MDLHTYPVIVVCFVQEGCPACESFLPLFKKAAAHYGACIPSAIVRADKETDLADAYWVKSTPTTLILHHGRRSPYLYDYAVTEEQLHSLYGTILRGLSMRGQACEL